MSLFQQKVWKATGPDATHQRYNPGGWKNRGYAHRAPRFRQMAGALPGSAAQVNYPARNWRNLGPPANLQAPRMAETKCVDMGSGATTPAYTPLALNTTGSTVQCVNVVSVGSGFNNRVGRKVTGRTLRLTGIVIALTNARTAPMDYGRLVVVYDRQPNGGTPAITDILQAVDSGQPGNPYANAFVGVNMNNRDRFSILRDKRFIIPASTSAATGLITNPYPSSPADTKGGPAYTFDEFILLKDLVTQYKADASPSTSADIATGAIWIFAVAAVNAAGSENFQIAWGGRYRYNDS